jgi:hypothetical protein
LHNERSGPACNYSIILEFKKTLSVPYNPLHSRNILM